MQFFLNVDGDYTPIKDGLSKYGPAAQDPDTGVWSLKVVSGNRGFERRFTGDSEAGVVAAANVWMANVMGEAERKSQGGGGILIIVEDFVVQE